MENNQLPPMWVPADNFGRPIPPQAVPLDAQGRPIPPRWVLVDAYGRVLPNQPVQEQPMQAQEQPVQGQSVPVQGQVVQPAQEQPVQPVQAQPAQPQPVKEKKAHGNAEGTIGKILMAVLASVFIVISLGIFALVVFPDLSDLAKLLVIAAISFIFFGVGLVLTKKNPQNHVFFTILNCGIAMVYTSNIIYYGMFNSIGFFPLLLVWAVVCAWIAKKKDHRKSIVFIVQCCNVVSSCYVIGVQGRYYNLDAVLGAIALLVSLAICFVLNHEEKYYLNWQNWIPAVAGAVVATSMFIDVEASGVYGYLYFGVMSLMIVIAMVAGYTCYWLEANRSVGFGIYNGIFLIMLGCLIDEVLDGSVWITDVIMIVVFLIALLATEKRVPGKYAPGKIILQVVCLLFSAVPLMTDYPFSDYSIIGIFAMIVLAAGFLMDNLVYKIAGLAGAFMFVFDNGIEWLHLLFGIILIAEAIFLIYFKKEQYKGVVKIPVTIFAFFLLLTDVSSMLIDFGLPYVKASLIEGVVTILAVAAFHLIPKWNYELTEKKVEMPTYVTNLSVGGVTMIYSISIMEDSINRGGVAVQILSIVIAAVLWASMTIVLFRKSKIGWVAATVGALWAILIGAIMGLYEVPGNVISIVGICFSIICIVIGFVVAYRTDYDYAPLRMLGLILVLISLLKLLIWDIEYTTMLARAISFFLAGILCLAISLIYSFVEKKFKKEKQEQNETTAEVSQGL